MRWAVSVTPRPYPRKDPISIVKEAWWVPRLVYTGAVNLAYTRIRSLDRPALSESLYRLNYRDPAGNEGKSKKLRSECPM